MIRINLMLTALVVASAFYLVHTQYEFRRLYTELDRTQAKARQIEAEHEQLRVQRQAQATPAHVQQMARRQLQMRPVTPGVTEYVTALPADAAAVPVQGQMP